jgi:signal transduction histidine kinase
LADFLSLLVHEMRTPLTSLRGALGLLSGAAGDASEEVRTFSALADRSAARLTDLLDDVAAYAWLRRADVRISVTAVDLTTVLEQAAERTQPLAESRGVTIQVQRPSTDAHADDGMLRDAVSRMLSYAVRVTPQEGLVQVSAETAGSRTVIRVADQGAAVREADFEVFFDPFSPVARRGVKSANRAGFDLAIAKLVAEHHGGTLEYRQITGGGVVRLTLGPKDPLA